MLLLIYCILWQMEDNDFDFGPQIEVPNNLAELNAAIGFVEPEAVEKFHPAFRAILAIGGLAYLAAGAGLEVAAIVGPEGSQSKDNAEMAAAGVGALILVLSVALLYNAIRGNIPESLRKTHAGANTAS